MSTVRERQVRERLERVQRVGTFGYEKVEEDPQLLADLAVVNETTAMLSLWEQFLIEHGYLGEPIDMPPGTVVGFLCWLERD
jgi:hypothetical protein